MEEPSLTSSLSLLTREKACLSRDVCPLTRRVMTGTMAYNAGRRSRAPGRCEGMVKRRDGARQGRTRAANTDQQLARVVFALNPSLGRSVIPARALASMESLVLQKPPFSLMLRPLCIRREARATVGPIWPHAGR